MLIPEVGDIVTPIDDPCQFEPAWRSVIAGYLFSRGVRTKEDFDNITRSGSVTVNVTVSVTVTQGAQKRSTANASKHKNTKKIRKDIKKNGEKPDRSSVTEKVSRPIEPFNIHPNYRVFASDPWIRSLVFMYNDQVDGRPLLDEHVPLRLATRWYSEPDNEAAIKKRIEPLLLTGIDMDVLTLDLIGLPSVRPAFEAYERLYFNCRDENWCINKSMQLIQRMAMPWGPLKTHLRKNEFVDDEGFIIGDGRPLAKDSDVWRAVAATCGYEALMYMWKWDRRAHGMKENSLEDMIAASWRAAVSRLFTDIYNGDIRHEDAARILAAYTAQSKKISDDRRDGAGEGSSDTTKALLDVLQLVAPKMILSSSGDGESAGNSDIQNHIMSQMAIEKQVVEDAGADVAKAIIDAQIAGAIDQ